jgi:hypothetical protein
MNTKNRIVVTFAALAFSVCVSASETDQYFERSEPIADSTEALNRKLNVTLAKIVAKHRTVRDQRVIVYKVSSRLGGHHFVDYRLKDKYEKWALKSPTVATRKVAIRDSIYGNMPPWSIRAVAVFGLGDTIRVNDQLIGSDKLSHFLSQGRKFYHRYQKSGSENKAARRGVLTERAIFGSGMTGSFSNADLVANYEGFLFYQSLFEDDVIPGKPAIFRWDDDGWIMQREFDWADHVNEYWDEALNVNAYDWLLRHRMAARLADLCPRYWRDPTIYTIEDEEVLQDRYAHLGLRDTKSMRLGELCQGDMGKRDETILAANDAP